MLCDGEISSAEGPVTRLAHILSGDCSWGWARKLCNNFVRTYFNSKPRIYMLTISTAGINVTSYYLPTVLIQSVGLTNSLARLLAACNSVSYLLFSLIGIPNVERWGRRKMMMYAAAGQFFCYAIITICIRYTELDSIDLATQRSWAKGSIAFFFLYYVFFGIGWQGVPWVSVNLMIDRCG
jgi:hypothetical protein